MFKKISIFVVALIAMFLIVPTKAYAAEPIEIIVEKGNPETKQDPPYLVQVLVKAEFGLAELSNSLGNTYACNGEAGHRIKFYVQGNGTYTVYAKDTHGNEAKKDIVIENLVSANDDTTPPKINVTQGNPSTLTNPPYEIQFAASDNVGLAFVYIDDTLLTGNYIGYTTGSFRYTVNKNGTYIIKVIDEAGLSTTQAVEITNIGKVVPQEVTGQAPKEPVAETQAVTEKPLETVTEAVTEKSTEKVTEKVTEIVTETTKKEPQTKTLKNADVKEYQGQINNKINIINKNTLSPFIKVIMLILGVGAVVCLVLFILGLFRKKDLKELKDSLEMDKKEDE